MILLGLALLAIGLGDLVAGGIAGTVTSSRRALAGTALAIATASAGAFWTGSTSSIELAVLLSATATACLGWTLLRCPSISGRSPWLALGCLVLPIAALIVLSGYMQAPHSGAAASWLAALPFPALSRLGLDRFCLATGTAATLIATANGIVRTVLEAAGTPFARSEQRLRGGRLIGPLERLMIFGLALAGDPTAAALIVSAKSLLRFPEISRAASTPAPTVCLCPDDTATRPTEQTDQPCEVDSVTEYFLLGSLTSWLLALAPVLILKR